MSAGSPAPADSRSDARGLGSRAAAVRWSAGAARRWPVVALAAGVALFVGAGMTAAFAGSDVTATRHTAHRHAAADALAQLFAAPSATPSATATSAVASAPAHVVVRRAVVHGTAPADASAISALASNGIPEVALNAYRVAAARVDNADPGCGISWWLLAGIGRVESDHGQYGGAVLHADGLSTPEIIGPALNGDGNQRIAAPANGAALDGDAVYAHALGPMQFIPSTWAIYGADADGDGVANVFDINDAALGTARYLCAAGGNLRVPANRVRAVFSYNHTDTYVAEVLALADAYRHGIAVTGIPRGNLTGSLPGLGHGSVPVANPVGSSSASRNHTQPTQHLRHGASTSATASSARSASSSPTHHRSASPSPSRSSSPTAGSSSPSPSPSGSSSGLCLLGSCIGG